VRGPKADGIKSDGANTQVIEVTVTGRSSFAATGDSHRNIYHTGHSTLASGSRNTDVIAGDTYIA
jgi:hypothetical protein